MLNLMESGVKISENLNFFFKKGNKMKNWVGSIRIVKVLDYKFINGLNNENIRLTDLRIDWNRAVKRSNCFHKNGHNVKCSTSNTPFMIIFAIIQIILSQIPNFHNLSWLSILAAVMSFSYASIGVGLSIAKVAGTFISFIIILIISSLKNEF